MSGFLGFVLCALPGLIEISSGWSSRNVLFLPTVWVTYCREGAWISPWPKMTVFAVIYGCVFIFFSLKTMYSKCKMFFFFFFEKCTLALFETRCTFLSFSFIKCWDVYKRKNFGKIKHRLFHGRVGRGVGSILDLTSRPSRKGRAVYPSLDLTNYFVCMFAKPCCHANQFVTSNRE